MEPNSLYNVLTLVTLFSLYFINGILYLAAQQVKCSQNLKINKKSTCVMSREDDKLQMLSQ
jgi:hypothetical protein